MNLATIHRLNRSIIFIFMKIINKCEINEQNKQTPFQSNSLLRIEFSGALHCSLLKLHSLYNNIY